MAINLYKDDDPSKKVGTGVNSVAAPTVTPAVPAPKDPVPVGQTDNENSTTEKNTGLKIEDGPKTEPNADTKTAEDVYASLCSKIRNGQTLSPEEQELYDKMSAGYKAAEKKAETKATEDNTASKATNTESEADKAYKEETKKKYGEYKALENKGGTEYEKTSRILDKYLSENDESYKALQEKLANTKDSKQKAEIEKQLRAKRDKVIHDWQAVVNPNIDNKSLSLKDRQRGIHEIGQIFSLAGAGVKSLEEFKNPKNLEKIKKLEGYGFLNIISNTDFSQAKTTDDKINMFVDNMLQTDSQYKKLQGKEKEEYRIKVLCTQISDQLGVKITPEMYNSGRAKILKEIIVGMVSEGQKSGKLGIDIFESKNQRLLAKKILNYFDKQSDFINSLDASEKKDLEKFKARISIVANLDINNEHTKVKEKDIYKYLKDNEKTLNPAEKELLAEYRHMHDIGISLDTEYDMKNAMSLSIMFGKPIDGKDNSIEQMAIEYMKDGINSANPKERESRLVTFLGLFVGSRKGSTIHSNGIAEFQKCTNMSDVELKKVLSRDDMQQLLGRQHAQAYARSKESGDWSEYGKSISNISKSKPNEKLKATIKACSANMTEQDQINAGKNKDYQNAIIKNQDITNAITSGMNEALSEEATQRVFSAYKSYGNNAFTTAMSTSVIKTASPQRQESLGKKLLELHNDAITEGVAAAEKYVDASVKEAYSKNLDKEINSGRYTAEQKANFKTARETGQTSYERAQSSEGAKSETASSNKSTSASVSSSTSDAAVPPVKVTVSTIYISQESKTYANEIKATLAQLDSESKKADAMKKVAENIEKIQKEAIKYEQKAEQKRIIEEQKQKAQDIQKENEKKTQAQLKEELSKAVSASVDEIETEEAKVIAGSINFEEIKKCAQNGQLTQVYNMLSQIPRAQERFLEKLATQHISTISHFIKGADKSILKFMCEKNPGILSTLDTSTLMVLCNSGFPKSMIIKYGDKNQVAAMLTNLQMASTKETLNEFYEVMGLSKSEQETTDASEIVKKNDEIAPGSDEWYALQSTPVKLPMRGNYDKMQKKGPFYYSA